MAVSNKKRGVLYIVWGRSHEDRAKPLRRSIESLYKRHPELPIHVHELGAGASLLDKSKMYQFSPFEETLYLDIDTVVMGRLDFGFEQSNRHRIACCICEAPYAHRYDKSGITGDAIEYNTGVIFFRKSPDAERLFAEWTRLAGITNTSTPYVDDFGGEHVMPCNDQGSFAKAVHDLAFNPFVLPLNWNFRSQWQKIFNGPLKVWHNYAPPPQSLIDANVLIEQKGRAYPFMVVK